MSELNLSKIKIVEVPYAEVISSDFKPPAPFYVVNACGDHVYIKSSDRASARAKADEMYGKNFYSIRVAIIKDESMKQWTDPDNYKPCRGTATRRGQVKPN